MSERAASFPWALALLAAQACAQGQPNQQAVRPEAERGAVSSAPSQRGGRRTMRGDNFFDQHNLEKYVGRKVTELVSAAPQPYRSTYPVDEPPGKLQAFGFEFPGGSVVEVH